MSTTAIVGTEHTWGCGKWVMKYGQPEATGARLIELIRRDGLQGTCQQLMGVSVWMDLYPTHETTIGHELSNHEGIDPWPELGDELADYTYLIHDDGNIEVQCYGELAGCVNVYDEDAFDQMAAFQC